MLDSIDGFREILSGRQKANPEAFTMQQQKSDWDFVCKTLRTALDGLSDMKTNISALTHPPVSQPLPTAKPQGEARECWVAFGVPGIAKAARTEAEAKEIPWLTWTHMREVHPIEGKGSAGDAVNCQHKWEFQQTEIAQYHLCLKCWGIGNPVTGHVMVYVPENQRRVPPDAPANHIPDTSKMVQSDLLDAIDKLESVMDECSAAHEHGDNTVDALPTLTPLLDVMKYLKSLHIPENMQSKAADPLYDKSAEFRAGYLWGIGDAADHTVDMRDMIPKAAPEVVEGAPRGERVSWIVALLEPFLSMDHGEECAARTEENEDDIARNPTDYLENCDCSVRPIFEAWDFLTDINPQGDERKQ